MLFNRRGAEDTEEEERGEMFERKGYRFGKFELEKIQATGG
ncbi:hypothetical protein [Scytonema sp. UIC 10036]|nr:hypothetical protein [Scytonema sp. UIC 10036]